MHLLYLAAAFSFTAALLHFACIFWGAEGFRVLGAGEPMVRRAARGDWYPHLVAGAIGAILTVWAAYALSAAGAIGALPWTRTVLSAITAAYLVRASAAPWIRAYFPGNSTAFWFASSALCLVIGLVHLAGLLAVWPTL